MNINISGRIWPAPKHDSDKTRAVKCCPTGGMFTGGRLYVVLSFVLIIFLCSLADLLGTL